MPRRPFVLASLLALGAAAYAVAAPPVDDGYQPPALLRVEVEGDPALEARRLATEGVEVLVVGERHLEVVAPRDQAFAGDLFTGGGVEVEVLEENLDDQLAAFRGRDDAGAYHTVAEAHAEMRALAEARPDLVQLEVIGTSHEGREILAARVSAAPEGAPSYMVVGMHHAREWIAVEVPMGLLHWLVESYDSDPEARAIVDGRETWVVPVVNPDGLAYSQQHSRMWRKNRRHNHDGSYGVDPNRNYGHVWGQAGASPRPSSDTYRGPEAFSEPETQALRDLATREKFVGTLSYHSYGELVLWPWSYGYEDAPDADVLGDHARAMAALCGFSPKQSSDLYPSSGDFDDWFYGRTGSMSFTIELGRRFVPRESKIPGIVADQLKVLSYFLQNCEGFEAPPVVRSPVPGAGPERAELPSL